MRELSFSSLHKKAKVKILRLQMYQRTFIGTQEIHLIRTFAAQTDQFP
jgi:hypothetical protein